MALYTINKGPYTRINNLVPIIYHLTTTETMHDVRSMYLII